MSQWHSRLTILSNLRIQDDDENEEHWTSLDGFVKILQNNCNEADKIKVRKDAIVKKRSKSIMDYQLLIQNAPYQ